MNFSLDLLDLLAGDLESESADAHLGLHVNLQQLLLDSADHLIESQILHARDDYGTVQVK